MPVIVLIMWSDRVIILLFLFLVQKGTSKVSTKVNPVTYDTAQSVLRYFLLLLFPFFTYPIFLKGDCQLFPGDSHYYLFVKKKSCDTISQRNIFCI